MPVGWYLARASLRRRAWSTVAFVVVIGLTGGIVLAGIAGARRTEDAFDQMVRDYRAPNAVVFPDVDEPEPGEPPPADPLPEASAIVAELPEVRAQASIATALIALEDPEGSGTWVGDLAFSALDERGFVDVQRPLVVDGRLMDPTAPDEVQVNEAWAERHDVEVGDHVELGLVPEEQLDAAGNGFPIDLAEPPLSYEVVGIVRKPADLSPPRPGMEGTIDEAITATVYLPAAFWAAHGDSIASYGSGIAVRLDAATDIETLAAAVEHLPVQVSPDSGENGNAVPSIATAVDVEARALLVSSVVFGLVAALLLAQAVRRRATWSASSMREVGVGRRSFSLATAMEWGLIGAGAGVVAFGVAVALSPLTPIGIARDASVSTGASVDTPVLVIGTLVLLLAFVVGGALLGWFTAGRVSPSRSRVRPSRLAGWASAATTGPGAGIGVRFALEPGAGDRAVPVRAAVASGVLGVAALVAASTFTASLDQIVENPVLRGWTWDYDVGNYSEPDQAVEGRERLLANPGVVEQTGWLTDVVVVDGEEVPLLLLDDQDALVAPQALEGRLPTGLGEIALASGTLEALDLTVGDTVEAVGPNGLPVEHEIVGETVGISMIDETASLDEGAIQTFDGVQPMLLPDQQPWAQGYLVRLADGEAGREGLEQLRTDFPGTVFGARSTPDIENLRRVQWLPRITVIALGLLALGSIAHSLVSAVRHRRRELAVLKCVGMRGGQLVGIAMAQAATLAVIAVALGIPAGVIAGRALWRLAAEQIGTFAGPVVQGLPLALGALAVVSLSVALAALPGRAAARTPTASILRAE